MPDHPVEVRVRRLPQDIEELCNDTDQWDDSQALKRSEDGVNYDNMVVKGNQFAVELHQLLRTGRLGTSFYLALTLWKMLHERGLIP